MERWIIPCNPSYYDIEGALTKLKIIDYKQSNKNIKVGDYIYIYVTKPYKSIKYLCKVNKVDLDSIEIDDSEFVISGEPYETYPVHMQIELIKKYDNELTKSIMENNGVKGIIQGPRRVCDELYEYIKNNNLE